MLPDDPDAHARLFYLSALGLLIAAGVVSHYRQRMGQAVQHLAIWGLIFVGVVLAIGFVEPLKRQLFNDEAVMLDARTASFERAADGHFYATMDVNGRAVEFMIDTGATALVLAHKDARAAGIDVDALNYTLPTSTANGRVMSARVWLDEVRLGDFTDTNVRATVSSGALDQSLLGMSYLDLYRGFEVDGDRFYLKR